MDDRVYDRVDGSNVVRVNDPDRAKLGTALGIHVG